MLVAGADLGSSGSGTHRAFAPRCCAAAASPARYFSGASACAFTSIRKGWREPIPAVFGFRRVVSALSDTAHTFAVGAASCATWLQHSPPRRPIRRTTAWGVDLLPRTPRRRVERHRYPSSPSERLPAGTRSRSTSDAAWTYSGTDSRGGRIPGHQAGYCLPAGVVSFVRAVRVLAVMPRDIGERSVVMPAFALAGRRNPALLTKPERSPIPPEGASGQSLLAVTASRLPSSAHLALSGPSIFADRPAATWLHPYSHPRVW